MVSEISGSDWRYRTEGGQHLVYYYVGTNPSFRNQILRVRSLKKCEPSNSLPTCDEEKAMNSLLQTKLRPFLVKSQNVTITTEAIMTLAKIAGPCRPLERIRTNLLPEQSMSGLLQDDLARLFGDRTLCVEVKPKSAAFSLSRLVAPEICRTLKKFTVLDTHLHKFCLNDVEEGLAKGTLYNPVDLMSGDPSRVRRALEILRKSKSRWLRIFSAGNFVAASDDVANNHFQSGLDHDHPCCSLAIRLCTSALTKSTRCLSLLQQIQSFDHIDKIGLEYLWNHLVNNLGCDNATEKVWQEYLEARSMVEDIECQDYGKWKNIVSYDSQRQAILEHNEMSYRHAMLTVNEMPCDIGARMIADSMMSAVAKDCSIVVSLAQVSGEIALNDNELILDEENGVSWRFKVHVIDVGPKPLSKISSWAKLDRSLAKHLSEIDG